MRQNYHEFGCKSLSPGTTSRARQFVRMLRLMTD
jgi:hypothetical protein